MASTKNFLPWEWVETRQQTPLLAALLRLLFLFYFFRLLLRFVRICKQIANVHAHTYTHKHVFANHRVTLAQPTTAARDQRAKRARRERARERRDSWAEFCTMAARDVSYVAVCVRVCVIAAYYAAAAASAVAASSTF